MVRLLIKYHCFIADGFVEYTTILDGTLYLWGVSPFLKKYFIVTEKYMKNETIYPRIIES